MHITQHWITGLTQRVLNSLERTMLSRHCMIWLLPTPSFPPLPLVSSTGDTQKDWERETTCWRERRGGGEGAKSYDGDKAFVSINHSILFWLIEMFSSFFLFLRMIPLFYGAWKPVDPSLNVVFFILEFKNVSSRLCSEYHDIMKIREIGTSRRLWTLVQVPYYLFGIHGCIVCAMAILYRWKDVT